MASMMPKLDQERVEKLTGEIGTIVSGHLGLMLPENVGVLEVLNALGIVVGTVLAGTGSDPNAYEFFAAAIAIHDLQMASTLEKMNIHRKGGSA